MDPNSPNPPQPNQQPQAPYSYPPQHHVQHHGDQHGPAQQPVAYDPEGRPLYAQPGSANLVYLAKPINPIEQPISPKIMQKHEESRRQYPQLNLSKGEYVISAIRRHPIGLLRIWFLAIMLIAAFMAMYVMFFAGPNAAVNEIFTGDSTALKTAAVAGLGLMIILVIAGAMAASYVYNNNRFFLTNESVIQEIQTTIFAKHEQTVSLANIEDASFQQNGIIPSIFNYATIRLSTEGDETTYRFNYVAHPKKQIAVLNNAVEAFKNGRPVDPEEDLD